MLTREEFKRHAEIAAAHKHGEDHKTYYVFRQYARGPLGAVSIALALALGLITLVRHVHLPHAPAHVGLAYWLVVAGLAAGTWLAFRIRVIMASTALARIVVAALLWLGVITYGVVTFLL